MSVPTSGWSESTVSPEGAVFLDKDGRVWVVGKEAKRIDQDPERFSKAGLYEDDRRRHQDECR